MALWRKPLSLDEVERINEEIRRKVGQLVDAYNHSKYAQRESPTSEGLFRVGENLRFDFDTIGYEVICRGLHTSKVAMRLAVEKALEKIGATAEQKQAVLTHETALDQQKLILLQNSADQTLETALKNLPPHPSSILGDRKGKAYAREKIRLFRGIHNQLAAHQSEQIRQERRSRR